MLNFVFFKRYSISIGSGSIKNPHPLSIRADKNQTGRLSHRKERSYPEVWILPFSKYEGLSGLNNQYYEPNG